MSGAIVEAVEHRSSFQRNMADRIILAHECLDRVKVVEPQFDDPQQRRGSAIESCRGVVLDVPPQPGQSSRNGARGLRASAGGRNSRNAEPVLPIGEEEEED